MRQELPVRVAWEGPQGDSHSIAIVNGELCQQLDRQPGIAVLRITDGSHTSADVHVRLPWPPDVRRPRDGRWVIAQPWEYDYIPEDWVKAMRRADEAWVPTSFVRDAYIRSGVPPSKVVVIPHGIDPAVFNPGAEPRQLPGAKGFRFLFVGATIPRKGADLALGAYLRAFGPGDDVCLIVKEAGAGLYRQEDLLGAYCRGLEIRPDLPEVIYLDDRLAPGERPGLYTACQALVQPYRGEGFALPIAEAMACGLAVIVPDQGACLDYCDTSVATLVPARRIQARNRKGHGMTLAGRASWFEVDVERLAAAMRRAYEDRAGTRQQGRRASMRVRSQLTWSHAGDLMAERIRSLSIRRQAWRPTLSACVVTRDEEASLERCLNSVSGVADEMIVVDTGSADGTVALARSLGARVHVHEWQGDLGMARNDCLRQARSDWILALDADEQLDQATAALIPKLLRGRPVGHLLRIQNHMDDHGVEAVLEHLALRLFPYHPDLTYGAGVHALPEPARPEFRLRQVRSEVIIHHHGYNIGPDRYRAKLDRNLQDLQRLVAAAPGNVEHAYYLGTTYRQLGLPLEAEHELRRALELCSGPGSCAPTFRAQLNHALAMTLLDQGRAEEAADRARLATRIVRRYADSYLVLGKAELLAGRPREALGSYRKACRCRGRVADPPTDRGAATWKPLLGMAEAYRQLGEPARALAALSKAERLAPGSQSVAQLRSLLRPHP